MYKNVQSKVYTQTKTKNGIPHPANNFRKNNKLDNQVQKPKKIVRPNSASANSIGIKSSFNNSQQKSIDTDDDYNFNYNYEQPKSMFDEYYKDKLMNINYTSYLKNNNNLNNMQVKNPNEPTEEQIYENIQNLNNQRNNEIIYNNNYNENYNLETNQSKVSARPLSATNKYLENNKYIISCIQNANNSNKIKMNHLKAKENPYHKEFGKTPKYLENMKMEAERKKEIEKIKKEEAKYPKGTRLLSEEERLFTLEKLKQSKNDINQIIEKLPITCDSQAFRNKKEELFKKLDEIENAIETFSKKKVFVKVENS